MLAVMVATTQTGAPTRRAAERPAVARTLGLVQWRKIRIRRVLLRLLQAVIAVQGATLLALAVVDYRRKRLRRPAEFPARRHRVR